MDNNLNWLDELLKEKGITPADLSRSTKLDSAVISNIRNGRRGVGPDTATAIAKALKLPVEQVFRLAGLLPANTDDDPWVEEQSHKLTLIPANMRGVAGRFIDSMVANEETDQKSKARKKAPSTSGRGVG